MKKKTLVINLSDEELSVFIVACTAAGTTPSAVVSDFLRKFLADPYKFVSVLNSHNNGMDVPGGDELSK